MSEGNNPPSFYTIADRFINLANDINKEDSSGAVGVGLRYAAARYSAFEATMRTNDLTRDKEQIIEEYLDDYRKMLTENFDDYAQRMSHN